MDGTTHPASGTGRGTARAPASGGIRVPARPHRTPVLMHVDMDAFYASVELARHPELRGRPMWVGGAARGVVLSASYEARAQGVRSGMSCTRARRLCPSAVAVAPDLDTYTAASRGIHALLRTVSVEVEVASIDEAFLDLTGALRRLGGDPVLVGEQVRARIADEQGITCSVGIAPTRFVAKLASQQAKPDGLVCVRPDEVVSFLHPLPVEAMWGVGAVTAEALHRLGLDSIADLAHTPRHTLQRAFGVHQGSLLHDLAWGRDERGVIPTTVERSIGSQQTFARDTDDARVVGVELLRLSSRVAARMRAMGVLCRVVTIHLRFADFSTLSRSTTLRAPTDVTDEVHAAAMTAFRRLNLQRARIRRVGVRVEGLVDLDRAHQQPTLDAPEHGMREAELAADRAVQRFGPLAVRRASLTRNEPRRPPVPSGRPVDADPLARVEPGTIRDEVEGWFGA